MRTIPLLLAALAAFACGGCAATTPVANGSDVLELDRQAELDYRQGRYESAVRAYEALVETVPADAGYWYRLANAYARADRGHDALLAYERSLAREPGNARAWHNRGVILLRQAQESFRHSTRVAEVDDPVRAAGERALTAIAGATRGATPLGPAGVEESGEGKMLDPEEVSQ